MHYFDSRDMTICPEHVLGSSARPPAFPAVCIDGECPTRSNSIPRRPTTGRIVVKQQQQIAMILGSMGDTMKISPKSLRACPWYLQPLFWLQRRKFGAVLDSARLWARSPKVFLGVAFLYGMLDRKSSPLPPLLRSLVTVRVSQLNGCPFCIDVNSATLLKQGVPLGKIEALDQWRQSDLFSEHERIALEYAEIVTLRCNAVDNELMERLKGQFDDDAIIELTALIAFQNLSSKFNSALGLPPQGFCKIPTRVTS